MTDTDLKSILRSADRAFDRETASIDSRLVHGRVARRRIVRHTAVSAAMVSVVVLIAIVATQSRTAPRQIAQPTTTSTATEQKEKNDIVQLQQQLDELKARTEQQETRLATVRSEARLVELKRQLTELEQSVGQSLPPSVHLQAEIQRLAAQRFVLAEAIANQYKQPNLAAQQYRRVIDQFPNTRWSADAQTALARLQM